MVGALKAKKDNPRHAMFVAEYIHNSGNGTQAAIAAGYAAAGAATTAWRLLQQPHICRAIQHGYRCKLSTDGVAVGERVVRQLAVHGESEAVKLNAAKELLARGGIESVDASEAKVHPLAIQINLG